MDFVGRLSSEQKEDSADDGGGAEEEETGIISRVSELELTVTITTEGSRLLGKTATCSRSVMAREIQTVSVQLVVSSTYIFTIRQYCKK